MARARICDRCKQYFPESKRTYPNCVKTYLKDWDDEHCSIVFGGVYMDLCPTCVDALNQFLKEGSNEAEDSD